jgi:hypothetical protein
MNRFLIVAVTAAGACAVAFPAFAGLSGNPSFSHRIPVRVPSQAKLVHFDDHGHPVSVDPTTSSPSRVPSSATGSSESEPEPTDDHGAASAHVEPGDDHGGARASTEPGDDNSAAGEHSSVTSEPGDDNGTDTPTSGTGPAEDTGSHGGHSGSTGSDGGSHSGR